MSPPRLVVLDTHTLIWHFSAPKMLSARARLELQGLATNTVKALIPAIVLAELLAISEKRRLPVSVDKVLATVDRKRAYDFVVLDRPQVEEAVGLPQLREIHDRLIVAATRLLGATLITKDAVIRDSGLVSCLW